MKRSQGLAIAEGSKCKTNRSFYGIFLPQDKSTQRIINGTVKESESLRAIDFATKIVECSSLQAWDIGCLFFVFARSLRSFIMSRSHSDTMLFVRFAVRRY